MSLFRSLIGNNILQILLKIVFFTLIILDITYFSLQLALITDLPFNEVNQERQLYYAMIGFGLLSIVYYILSKSEYSHSLSTLLGTLRTNLREDDTVSQDDRILLLRKAEQEFQLIYFTRQIIFAVAGTILYIVIIYTQGIFDLIAKGMIVVIAILYYRKYQENPLNSLNAKNFRDQKIDDEGVATMARTMNKGYH